MTDRVGKNTKIHAKNGSTCKTTIISNEQCFLTALNGGDKISRERKYGVDEFLCWLKQNKRIKIPTKKVTTITTSDAIRIEKIDDESIKFD